MGSLGRAGCVANLESTWRKLNDFDHGRLPRGVAINDQAGFVNPMVNRVIQEMALDLASERYRIGSVTHVMSAANHLPDILSRIFEAEATQIPSELNLVPRRQVARRDMAFWHTIESRDSC